MKILITGSNGMLGSALRKVLSAVVSNELIGLDIQKKALDKANQIKFLTCDITNFSRLKHVVDEVRPDVIIHAAAYTDVDGCELHPDKAETINGLGTRNVAELAKGSGAGLIYVSTDYVFDGEKRDPYSEEDTPNPISVYGRSKLDGERFVEDTMKGRQYFIVRTGWLFGDGGKNFIDTILKKAKGEKRIKIISDQFGSPTYTADLAGAIGGLTGMFGRDDSIYGIYHITNSDDCSWYKLAEKTLELSNVYDVELIPIVTQELNQRAERPVLSILSNERYSRLSGTLLRRWDKALDEYLRLRR